MLYRNFLAMETEELLRSHPVDGAVLMGGCDKTTPGLVMGACRWACPSSTCPPGRCCAATGAARCWARARDAFKYWDERRAGRLGDAGVVRDGRRHCAQPGTCMTMGTAATMMGIAEALGLACPGASIPAADAQPPAHECRTAAARIVDMVWDDLTPKRMLCPRASTTPSPVPWRWAAPPTPSST
jgi:dihydroxy-acid dehydratase